MMKVKCVTCTCAEKVAHKQSLQISLRERVTRGSSTIIIYFQYCNNSIGCAFMYELPLWGNYFKSSCLSLFNFNTVL